MRLRVWNRRWFEVAIVVAAALLCALAVAASSGVARGAITTNPADRAALLGDPIEDLHYDFGKRCLSHPQPGTLAL
jgi:hypothetical protein